MIGRFTIALLLLLAAPLAARAQVALDTLSNAGTVAGTDTLPLCQTAAGCGGSQSLNSATMTQLGTYMSGATQTLTNKTLNCVSGNTCTLPAPPAGANPSATAGPTANNGSATTFMRSDASPAIQSGSATQQGILECGTGTSCTSGTISVTAGAPGGSTGNPQYNAGSGSFGGVGTVINAQAEAGADACAQIANAAAALTSGGIIDARGYSGTQNCAGTMFDTTKWPASPEIQLLLGPATFVQPYPFIVPHWTRVLGYLPALQDVGTIFRISNTFLSAIPAAPTLTAQSGGSLAAGTDFVKVTYANAVGESLGSAETSKTVTLNQEIVVTSPSAATGATQYFVYASTSSGNETLQNSGGTPIGTNYTITSIASGALNPPITSPVIQLGVRHPIATFATYGAEVEHVTADCTMPNGNNVSNTPSLQNLAGWNNETGQQNSWWRDAATWGCWTGFEIETSDAQNSGPYENLILGDSAILGAGSVCLNLGHKATGTALTAKITEVSCGSHSGGSQQTVSINLDATNVYLSNLDMEDAVTAVEVGSAHNTAGSTISNISCGNDITTTCVDISSNDSGAATLLMGVTNCCATDTLNDHATGGAGALTQASKPSIALYARSAGNTVSNF